MVDVNGNKYQPPEPTGYDAELTFAENAQAESFFRVMNDTRNITVKDYDVIQIANILHRMGEMLMDKANAELK